MGIQDRDAIAANLRRAGQAPTDEAINIWARHGASLDAMEGELFRGEITQSTIDGVYNQGKTLNDYTFKGEHLAGFEQADGTVSTRLDTWRPDAKPVYGASPVNGINLHYKQDEDGNTQRYVVFDNNFQGDPEQHIGHGDAVQISSDLAKDLDWDRFTIHGGNINKGEDLIVTRHNQTDWYQEDWAVVTGAIVAGLATGGLAAYAAGLAGLAGSAAGAAAGLSTTAAGTTALTGAGLAVTGTAAGAAGAFGSTVAQTSLQAGRLDSEQLRAGVREMGEGAVTGLVTAGVASAMQSLAKAGTIGSLHETVDVAGKATSKLTKTGRVAGAVSAYSGAVAGGLLSGEEDVLKAALANGLAGGVEGSLAKGGIAGLGSYMETDGDWGSALAVGLGQAVGSEANKRLGVLNQAEEWELDSRLHKVSEYYSNENISVNSVPTEGFFKSNVGDYFPMSTPTDLPASSLAALPSVGIDVAPTYFKESVEDYFPSASIEYEGGAGGLLEDINRINELTAKRDGSDGVLASLLNVAAAIPGAEMEVSAKRKKAKEEAENDQDAQVSEPIEIEMPSEVFAPFSTYGTQPSKDTGGEGVDRGTWNPITGKKSDSKTVPIEVT